MPIDEGLRFLFIINPVSGGNDKTQLVEDAKSYLEDAGHITHCYELVRERGCDDIKRLIDEWGPDRVIAMGGDGTLKIVAEQLVGTNIPIGLLPAGSANGMARELGLPNNIQDCLDVLVNGDIRPVDAVRINDRELSLHLSDIGLNAQLVKRFEQSDTRGKWGYIREVFAVLLRRKLLKVKIIVDGKEYNRKAFMIVIANARMYGTGAMINPHGDLSDGKMEIVLIKKISLWEVLKMMVKSRRFNPRKTEILQAETAVITSKNKAWFQVDGEYLGEVRKITATVEKHAFKMLLPATNDRH
jgi:YegS/Rv2252/BmrU family lipid kinase